LKNPLLTKNELRAYVDNPYVFSFRGDYWQINFNGEETLVRDLERVRYIIHLLEYPNKDFYCHELTKLVKKIELEPHQYYSAMGEDELANEGLNLVDLPIEHLEKDEKRRLELIACILWEQYKNSSYGSNQDMLKAKKQWEVGKRYLLNEYGIVVSSSNNGPIFRVYARLRNEVERARSNVTKQIKSAIKSIGVQIPSLADHLKNAISTGAKCCYRPDPINPIEWTILWNN
jgi:hypothetical protein